MAPIIEKEGSFFQNKFFNELKAFGFRKNTNFCPEKKGKKVYLKFKASNGRKPLELKGIYKIELKRNERASS